MTKITFMYDNNIIYGFRMEGHACYNLDGPDILCASLSATSQMTVNGILDWTGLSVDDCIVELEERNAIMHFVIPDRLYATNTVQQLFRSFEMYVETLETMYSENIKVERRIRDDHDN